MRYLSVCALAPFVVALGCATPSNTELPPGEQPGEETKTGSNTTPTASFLVTGDLLARGTVMFDASASSDAEADVLTYSWAFGDGQRGGGKRLAHLFAAEGTYTVTLTVADASGAVSSAAQSVTILAGSSAAMALPVTVTVRDAQGVLIVDADISVVGSPSAAKTNVSGVADIAVSAGREQTIRIFKPGFARQVRVVSYPASLPAATLDVVMVARPAAQTLADAALGGSLDASNGARISLPANALVDDAGNKISGAVDIAVTPLDVRDAGAQFPGGFGARNQEGAPGFMLSFGVTEFDLSQNGKHLNMAPGAEATVDLPMYATTHPNGVPIALGDEIALWSLDENVGTWVQEGTGIVVASSSGTGFSLRARVGHFSWWNCDHFANGKTGKASCRAVDVTATQEKIALVEAGVCTLGANYGDGGAARQNAGQAPVWAYETQIPFHTQVDFPIPSGIPLNMAAFAAAGTWGGSATISADTNDFFEIEITVAFTGTTTPTGPTQLSTPVDRVDALQNIGEHFSYKLTSTSGGLLRVEVTASGSSVAGDIALSANGSPLCDAAFNASTATCLVETTAGQILDLTVTATANVPGGFRLQANNVVSNTVTLPVTQALSLNGANPSEASILFEAVAGEAYEFSGAVVSGAGVSSLIVSEVATGIQSIPHQIALQTPLRLIAPRDGQYLVTLRNSTTSAITVNVTAQVLAGFAGKITTIAMPYFGVLPGVTGLQFVKFHANAGQVVSYSYDAVTGTQPWLTPHAPLASQYVKGQVCPTAPPRFTAPADGDYYLELDCRTSSCSGAVTIREVEDAPLPSSVFGPTGLRDGESRTYQWTLPSLSTFFFDTYGVTACAYSPDGSVFNFAASGTPNQVVIAGTYTAMIKANVNLAVNKWAFGVSLVDPVGEPAAVNGNFDFSGDLAAYGQTDYFKIPLTAGDWVADQYTSTFSATTRLMGPATPIWTGATVLVDVGGYHCGTPKLVTTTGDHAWSIQEYSQVSASIGSYTGRVAARTPVVMAQDASGLGTTSQTMSGLCDHSITSFQVPNAGMYRIRSHYLGTNLSISNAYNTEVFTAVGGSAQGGHLGSINNANVNANARFASRIGNFAVGSYVTSTYGRHNEGAILAGNMQIDVIPIAQPETLTITPSGSPAPVTRTIDVSGRHRFFRIQPALGSSFTVTVGGTAVTGQFHLYAETASYANEPATNLQQHTTMPSSLSNNIASMGQNWIIAVIPNETVTGDFTIQVTQ